jgi:amino acid transporter
MILKKGVLSLKENYGQAMAVTAPLGSVVSTTTAAISYAGEGIIIATILAFLASALWIYSLTIYTRRIASAGGYYTFVYSAWRSRKLAFTEALIEIFAFSLLNAVNSISIYLMINVLLQFYGVSLSTWIEILVILLGIIYPSISSFLLSIKTLLSKIVTISATVEVIFLILLFIIAINEQGGIRWDLIIPKSSISIGGLATAFILVMVSIDGAGASTYLGEETRKPLNNVTNGIWLAFLLGGISIVLGTYGLVALWNGSLNELAESSQPLFYEFIKYGLIPTLIVLLLSINSLLASNIGTTVGAARILFNLARENAAPKVLMKLNRYDQPIASTILVGIISGVFTIIGLLYLTPEEAFSELGALASIIWIAGRVLDSSGVPSFLKRLGENIKYRYYLIPWLSALLSSIGIIISLLIITLLQICIIISIVILGILWYLLKAKKGNAGILVVNEENEILTLDDYISKSRFK